MRERSTSLAELPIFSLDGKAVAEADLNADPTGDFGIGVAKARLTEASYSSMRVEKSHIVSLQTSGPVGVDVRIGDRRLTHTPCRGSIGISPMGADGAAETSGPMEAIFLRVSPECLALANAQLGHHGGVLVERMQGRDAVLSALACALEAEARAGHANGWLYWTSLTDALFQHLVVQHSSKPATARKQTLAACELARVDDYIRSCLASPLDIPSLAAVAGSDVFRFTRAFRSATGLSPHRYVTRVRLDHARALLREARLSLADVAAESGFCDQSHLSRWMRRVYGAAPGVLWERRRT